MYIFSEYSYSKGILVIGTGFHFIAQLSELRLLFKNVFIGLGQGSFKLSLYIFHVFNVAARSLETEIIDFFHVTAKDHHLAVMSKDFQMANNNTTHPVTPLKQWAHPFRISQSDSTVETLCHHTRSFSQ